MNETVFTSQLAIEEKAEKLGKEALQLGLIPNFTIHYFSDSWEFCIPNQTELDPLTPEEAYLYLKKLVEQKSESKSS
ncbi:hypothetical protein IQ238_22620 [Pleurocapsales cyanobacterium LEGE 06147]|nr:hypothetical protein [Pleurocapsales cyanobacterium LEGE 06147]